MDEKREILSQLVNELKNENVLWDEEPVSPTEFFDKFLGEPCYPLQQEFVDKVLGTDGPTWDTTYNEALALVGKGGGKDRTISKIVVYIVYRLLCMRNPQKCLMGNTATVESAIDIGNVSMNARLAKDVFFKNFKMLLKHVKNPKTGNNWFEEKGVELNKAILTREVKFPKNITVYSLDSEEYTGEGLNLLVVVYDEVGGFQAKKAKELYDALKKTQRSRYPLHHKTLLLSFPRDENDFMMTRFNQAQDEPTTWRIQHATWEWNPTKKKEDFSDDYVKDPVQAARVYECKVTIGERTYIRYREQLLENFTNDRENPCLNNEFWTANLLNLKFKPSFVPLLGTQYFAHIDLAKGKEGGDCAGIVIGHAQKNMKSKLSQKYLEELLKTEGLDFSKYADKPQLGLVIDLALQIRARAGQEIQLEEVRLFLGYLKHQLRFNIRKATYDGWQSLGEIQQMRKIGILSEEQSVDKDRIAYDTLKTFIYQGLFSCYWHPVLIRELEELQVLDNGKVDHPDNSSRRATEEGRIEGSKDVSDGAAGVARLGKEEGAEFAAWISDTRPTDTGKTPPSVQDDEARKLIRYGDKPSRRMNW